MSKKIMILLLLILTVLPLYTTNILAITPIVNQEVTITQNSVKVYTSDKFNINKYYTGCSNCKLTYSSSNTKVAKISKSGNVTILKAGKATITIKHGKKSFKVYLTSKTFSVTSSLSLHVNGSSTLKVTNPYNAEVTYTSNNPEIATIEIVEGVPTVSFKSSGTTKIITEYDGRKKETKVVCKADVQIAQPVIQTYEILNHTGFKMTWDAVDHANQYTIYRKRNKGKYTYWKNMGTTSNLSFIDKNEGGFTNQYKIVAKDSTGVYDSSEASNIVKLYIKNYIYLKMPRYINQLKEGAKNGCEGAALLMCLNYKGLETNTKLKTILNKMPKANTPYKGFIYSPYNCIPYVVHWIDSTPLAKYGNTFTKCIDAKGYNISQLIQELEKDNPVILYGTIHMAKPYWFRYSYGRVYGNLHIVVLDGYNYSTKKFHITDPIDGKYWISESKMKAAYNGMKRGVIVVGDEQ